MSENKSSKNGELKDSTISQDVSGSSTMASNSSYFISNTILTLGTSPSSIQINTTVINASMPDVSTASTSNLSSINSQKNETGSIKSTTETTKSSKEDSEEKSEEEESVENKEDKKADIKSSKNSTTGSKVLISYSCLQNYL